jgi:hypothetical protein|nr:MAG TPA: very short patch repair protein [Caudoviricetes sp.]
MKKVLDIHEKAERVFSTIDNIEPKLKTKIYEYIVLNEHFVLSSNLYEEFIPHIREKFNITNNCKLRLDYWAQRGWGPLAETKWIEYRKYRGDSQRKTRKEKRIRRYKRDWNWVTMYRAILSFKGRLVGEKREQVKQGMLNALETGNVFYSSPRAFAANLIFKLSGKSRSAFRVEYWLDFGYSLEEANAIVSKNSKQASDISYSAPKHEIRKRNVRCVEYWTSRGFSEEYGRKQISNNQTKLSSLEGYIEKYGEEEGRRLRKERTEKWIKTLKSKPNYKDICKSKGKTHQYFVEKYGEDRANEIKDSRITKYGISKESISFFSELCDILEINKDQVIFGRNEYKIKTQLKTYLYDFTDIDNKIIIEYQGIAFHSKQPGDINIFGIDTYDHDRLKLQTAKDAGFNVIEIWSDDNDKLRKAKEFYEEVYRQNRKAV